MYVHELPPAEAIATADPIAFAQLKQHLLPEEGSPLRETLNTVRPGTTHFDTLEKFFEPAISLTAERYNAISVDRFLYKHDFVHPGRSCGIVGSSAWHLDNEGSEGSSVDIVIADILPTEVIYGQIPLEGLNTPHERAIRNLVLKELANDRADSLVSLLLQQGGVHIEPIQPYTFTAITPRTFHRAPLNETNSKHHRMFAAVQLSVSR